MAAGHHDAGAGLQCACSEVQQWCGHDTDVDDIATRAEQRLDQGSFDAWAGCSPVATYNKCAFFVVGGDGAQRTTDQADGGIAQLPLGLPANIVGAEYLCRQELLRVDHGVVGEIGVLEVDVGVGAGVVGFILDQGRTLEQRMHQVVV